MQYVEIVARIDLLGKQTTMFTATHPKEKTLTVFYEPKDYEELQELQGKEHVAIFEIQPIQGKKLEYFLKKIKKIAQTSDAFSNPVLI